MTSKRIVSLWRWTSAFLLIAMIFSMIAPGISVAQETTDEPSVVPTETETEALPTELPTATETPTEQATESSTDAPAPTVSPPLPFDTSVFQSYFDNQDLTGWLLSPGWALASEGGNGYLATTLPSQSATINGVLWDHFMLSARIGVTQGNTANVGFRVGAEAYTLTLDANGNTTLYRGATELGIGLALVDPSVTPPPFQSYNLSLTVSGGTFQVALNGLPVFQVEDAAPLPAGLITFTTGIANTGLVTLDDVNVFRSPAPGIEPTPEVTPDPEVTPIVTPEPEVTPEITPDPEATIDPEATPELDPEATPELTPDPEATVDPEATPELDPEATVEPTPSFELDEATAIKIGSVLTDIVTTYENDGAEAAQEAVVAQWLEADAENRLTLVVWRRDEATAMGDIVTLVQSVGGEVRYVEPEYLEAYLPIAAILPLASLEEVRAITFPLRASSALPVEAESALISTTSASLATTLNVSEPQGYTGSVVPHSYDILSIESWHDAGVTGNNVTIAVIDVGFNGTITSEHACIQNSSLIWPDNGKGSGNDGLQTAELICDLAPNADVYLYRAGDISEVASAINAALSGGYGGSFQAADVIVISLPNPLVITATATTALNNAYNQNVPVIVAAGDLGTNATTTFTKVGDSTTATVSVYAYAGSTLNISKTSGTAGTTRLSVVDGAWSQNQGAGDNVSYTNLGGVPGSSLCDFGCYLTLEIIGGSAGAQYTVSVTTPSGTTPTATVTPGENTNTVSGATTLTGLADHPRTISVGAVCAQPSANFPILSTSSTGVVGQANNMNIKPSLVAPSGVQTSLANGDPANCNQTGVFSGTRSSAAHVAGVAALLMSNPGMQNRFANPSASAGVNVDNLKAYLQSRAIDANNNGFDNVYGAGVVQLGDPAFSFNNEQFLNREATEYPAATNVVYVSSGYRPLSGSVDGSYSNPFVHIQQALEVARLSGSIDTVIVMPGEYVSPFNVETSATLTTFAAVDEFIVLPSYIWANLSYSNISAVTVTNGNNTRIEGFVFNSSTPRYLTDEPSTAVSPTSPISVIGSDHVSIEGNTFNNFNYPLSVVNASDDVIIRDNLFRGFTVDTIQQSSNTALIRVDYSGTTEPIQLISNQFLDNVITGTSTRTMTALITIERSEVVAVAGDFRNNTAQSIFTINQWTNDPGCTAVKGGDYGFVSNPVTVASSLFQGNTLSGTVLHIYQSPNTYFVNNTVVNNSINAEGANVGYIQIGWKGIGTCPSGGNNETKDPHTIDHHYSINNNIFYDNTLGTVPSLIYSIGQTVCEAVGSTQRGTRGNWFVSSAASFALGGVCGSVTQSPTRDSNNNLLTSSYDGISYDLTNPDEKLAFQELVFFGTDSDPDHPYRLRPEFPAGVTQVNPGIDPGLTFDTYSADIYPDKSDLTFALDVLGGLRFFDLASKLLENGDLGAYETSDPEPVRFVNNAVNGDTIPAPSPGNTGYQNYTDGTGNFNYIGLEGSVVEINMARYVTGGFRPYTFTLNSQAVITNPDPTSACAGSLYQFDSETYILTVCPPENFHNALVTDPKAQITFTYQVEGTLDTGTTPQGTLTVKFLPLEDTTPRDASGEKQYVYLEIGNTTPAPLRPSVIFEPSFTLTDPSDIDYPYQFTNIQLVSSTPDVFDPVLYGGGDGIVSETEAEAAIAANINPNGVLTWVPRRGVTGSFEFTYSVTDGTTYNPPAYSTTTPGATVNNARRVLVQIVDRVTLPGMYDDTYIKFLYSDSGVQNFGGSWTPVYDTTARNSTKHSTATINDVLDINFVGTNVTLFMVGQTDGGNYRLQFDYDITDGITLQNYDAIGGLTCDTTLATKPGAGLISNYFGATQLYGITCTGFPANEVHKLRISNAQAGTATVFDGIYISDGSPLTPGLYDEYAAGVTYTLEQNWAWLGRSAANRQTVRYTSNQSATISFEVQDAAALRLYRTIDKNRGAYTVCLDVLPADSNCEISQVIDSYGTTQKWADPYTIGGLNSNLSYQVTIGNFAKSNTASIYWDLDAIEVLPAAGLMTEGWYQDTDPSLVYTSSWTKLAKSGASGGTFSYTSQSTARIDFQIQGTGLILYRTLDINRGAYEVCVGSFPCYLVDSYSSTQQLARPYIIAGLPFGTYNVTIRNFTKSNAASIYWDIDAIRVLNGLETLPPGTYQESDSRINLVGSWIDLARSGANGGGFSYTGSASAKVVFQIEGTGIELRRTTDAYRGTYRVCLDTTFPTCDEYTQIVNSYAPTGTYNVPVAMAGLPYDVYMVTIDQFSPAPYLDIDAVRVIGQPFSSGIHQTTDPGFAFTGIWTRLSRTDANGGSVDYTSDTKGGMQFSFTGSGFILYRSTSNNRGSYRVCLDTDASTRCDEVTQTVDSYVSSIDTNWNQPITINGLPTDTYTVTFDSFVKSQGTSIYWDVDAIQILSEGVLQPGYYEQDNPNINFLGTWTPLANHSRALGGSLLYTNSSSASINFRFSGEALALFRTTDAYRGAYRLCIDLATAPTSLCDNQAGERVIASINSFSSTSIFGVPYLVTGLDASKDYIATIDNFNPNPYVDLDAIQVIEALNPLASGEVYDDTDPDIHFLGPWVTLARTNTNNGTLQYTDDSGLQIFFDFTGSSITLYRTVDTNRGSYRVCLDSNTTTVCDEQTQIVDSNGTLDWNAPITLTPSGGTGTYRVTIDTLSGGPYWDLDAVAVNPGAVNILQPGYHEDEHPGITFSGDWSALTNRSEVSGKSLRYTTSSTATISFQFEGTGIVLYRTLDVNRGSYRVCVDGGTCQTVNSNFGSTSWQAPFYFTGFSNGVHSVTIDSFAGNPYVDLDAVQVLGEITRLEEGYYEQNADGLRYYGPSGLPTGAFYRSVVPEWSGGDAFVSKTQGSYLEFDIHGTGVVLRTARLAGGTNFRMCADTTAPACDEYVQTYSLNASATEFAHSFTLLNLPENDYSVRIITDGTAAFNVDSISVLGQPIVPITAGEKADDRDDRITYIGYTPLWSTQDRSEDYAGTQTSVKSHGGTVLFLVEGNAFTLYQTASTSYSRQVRICVMGETLRCAQADMYRPSSTWQVPVMIYGLGEGQHTVVVQNLNRDKWMSIDAVEVHED